MGKEVPKMINCMKCGREVALGQVFCKDCLEDMSHHPVNPTTPVQLPVQPAAVNLNRRPTRNRKAKKPEEQILRLRKQVRVQGVAILLLLTLLVGLGIYTYRKLFSSEQAFRPGENYISTEEAHQQEPPAN
jgi:hypothetical protein